jgi:hypothetical protein
VDFSVADEVSLVWPSENIPNEDSLWMRVHRTWIDSNGDIRPGAFQNRPTHKDGMSTDWAKYARPEDTRFRAKNPRENAVIQLIVGKVREIPDQTVIHTPDSATNNQAHTDVFGEKHTEARVKLSRIYKLVIPLDQSVSG